MFIHFLFFLVWQLNPSFTLNPFGQTVSSFQIQWRSAASSLGRINLGIFSFWAQSLTSTCSRMTTLNSDWSCSFKCWYKRFVSSVKSDLAGHAVLWLRSADLCPLIRKRKLLVSPMYWRPQCAQIKQYTTLLALHEVSFASTRCFLPLAWLTILRRLSRMGQIWHLLDSHAETTPLPVSPLVTLALTTWLRRLGGWRKLLKGSSGTAFFILSERGSIGWFRSRMALMFGNPGWNVNTRGILGLWFSGSPLGVILLAGAWGLGRGPPVLALSIWSLTSFF